MSNERNNQGKAQPAPEAQGHGKVNQGKAQPAPEAQPAKPAGNSLSALLRFPRHVDATGIGQHSDRWTVNTYRASIEQGTDYLRRPVQDDEKRADCPAAPIVEDGFIYWRDSAERVALVAQTLTLQGISIESPAMRAAAETYGAIVKSASDLLASLCKYAENAAVGPNLAAAHGAQVDAIVKAREALLAAGGSPRALSSKLREAHRAALGKACAPAVRAAIAKALMELWGESVAPEAPAAQEAAVKS